MGSSVTWYAAAGGRVPRPKSRLARFAPRRLRWESRRVPQRSGLDRLGLKAIAGTDAISARTQYRELSHWLRGIAAKCRLPYTQKELLDLARRYEVGLRELPRFGDLGAAGPAKGNADFQKLGAATGRVGERK
jgi:hypothetical protein